MPRTLYARLALVFIVLVTLLGIGFGGFTLYSSKLYLQELNQRFNRDLARQLLVDQNLLEGKMIDKSVIKHIFKRYMHINPSIEIYLLDADGKILAFEAPEQRIKRERVALEPIRRLLGGDMTYPILGDDPRHPERQKVFSVAAYPFHGEPRQYLYVVLAGEDYDTARSLVSDSYFLQLTLLAIIATTLFGIVSALFLFNLITRRLSRLSTVMEQFRHSGFRELAPYRDGGASDSGDEIERLGSTYDAMASRIVEQMQALEEKDSLRRNLIANVSHDLRTPLAALRGYLETLMLKTDVLPVEQRREFLSIAYRNSERLTTLISDLFELSKLDARESLPGIEPFAIGELVQDVAQQLRLGAEERDIRLRCEPVDGLPLVAGDIAMMERVLVNLIGNAIEHTPDGGEVDVALVAVDSGVEVAICNSGEGIREEDREHLFERFYQSPERRGNGGAGLGLAIVKRILELHGSTITVTTTPGVNTCFLFTLPLFSNS